MFFLVSVCVRVWVCVLSVFLCECVSVWVFAWLNERVSVWISYWVSEWVCERLSDCVSVWYPSLSCCWYTIVSMCITFGIMSVNTMRRRWRGMLVKKPFRRRKKNSSAYKNVFKNCLRESKTWLWARCSRFWAKSWWF